MTAKLISGNEIARQIREELTVETAQLKEKHNVTPGLVTILVGQNPASMSYVTAKQKASKELGFHSIQENQPETITEAELLALIDKYNRDPKIHGILVQLPLPKQINETKVLYAIDPKKDVDGFHPLNVGKLALRGIINHPDLELVGLWVHSPDKVGRDAGELAADLGPRRYRDMCGA